MNHRKPSRWLEAVAVPAFVCALLTMGTGCGAIKAAANPKVAWAINDPAPMSVVVRRADVAEKTSKEVDRLMTDTPASDDSPWLGQVAVDKEAATGDMTELKSHDLYVGGARVVAAEVWAKELSRIESKDAKAVAPAAGAAQPEPVAAAASKEAKAEHVAGKADKKAGKAGKKAAKSDKTDEKEALAAPAPAAAPAEAPAPAKYTSLLAAVDPELGAEWGKVMEKKKAMGEAKGEIAVLEAANDEKGISDADKKANKSKIEGLEKTVDRLEDEAEKLSKAFVPKAKAAAQKAAPEVREKFGPTLVHLRQAVADADISNSAAAVRYPMAATTLLDSAKQMAKVYVADVIEEKTGKRPSTQSLQPGVTMEGGNVQVTLNGLSTSDLGQLSIGDLTTEVASRTTAWAKRALGLLGTIAATKEVLGFEEDVLEALISGFQAAGWKAPAAATIPEAPAGGQPRS
ncbi:MAG: hypothetical protein KF764_06845 [Labilithrix sp.]|nr:hypothetical protein [Labilithrix sp.]